MKEAEGKDDFTDRALQSSDMDANAEIKNAGSQMLVHRVQSSPGSDGSCNSSSGSAVSALQSKFKEISQRQSKGRETHNVPLEGPSEPLHKKSDKEQSSMRIPEVKIFKWSSSADEVSEAHSLSTASHLKENKWENEGDSIHSLDCGLGEGSRMENCSTSRDGGTLQSKPSSSSRYWTPSQSFWKVAGPETLVSNTEVNFFPVTMKNMVHAGKEEEPKLRVRGTVVQKELQGLDSLESTFQKEQILPDEPGKKDIPDILSCQGGYKIMKPETEKAQTIKTTSAMLTEGQDQLPLTNKGEILCCLSDFVVSCTGLHSNILIVCGISKSAHTAAG